MKLYLIEYSNAQYCGGDLTCVARGRSSAEALEYAAGFMENAQRELFFDSYEEDGEDPDDMCYVVDSCEEFTPAHPYWRYYQDPSQAEFYPLATL